MRERERESCERVYAFNLFIFWFRFALFNNNKNANINFVHYFKAHRKKTVRNIFFVFLLCRHHHCLRCRTRRIWLVRYTSFERQMKGFSFFLRSEKWFRIFLSYADGYEVRGGEQSGRKCGNKRARKKKPKTLSEFISAYSHQPYDYKAHQIDQR